MFFNHKIRIEIDFEKKRNNNNDDVDAKFTIKPIAIRITKQKKHFKMKRAFLGVVI